LALFLLAVENNQVAHARHNITFLLGLRIMISHASCLECLNSTAPRPEGRGSLATMPSINEICLLKGLARHCNICFTESDLVRDHDHKTGYIRGILCSQCNSYLGSFEKELAGKVNKLRFYQPYLEWAQRHRERILFHLKCNTGIIYTEFVPYQNQKKIKSYKVNFKIKARR
jgi:recombination endonuclease VII